MLTCTGGVGKELVDAWSENHQQEGPPASENRDVSGEKDFSPKPLIDKLGVKAGHRVCLLGVQDEWFLADLRRAGADVSIGRARKHSDHLFLAVETVKDLARIGRLEGSMARNGAAWVVFPKGRKDLREMDVIRTGGDRGLVDNKVVRFSETHTALRFVIPVARR
jgi:hypothetical protein